MTEAELRGWHARNRWSKTGAALAVLGNRDGITYWDASRAAELISVERFDRPGECERAAMAVGRSLGLAVAFGWVAGVVNGEVAVTGHCWNVDSSGLIVDAAKVRIQPLGYLGVILEPGDVELLSHYVPGLATAGGQSGRGIPPIGKPSVPSLSREPGNVEVG